MEKYNYNQLYMLEDKLSSIYKSLLSFTKPDALRDKFKYNYHELFTLQDTIRDVIDCITDCALI